MSTTTKKDQVADAIRNCLISPSVADSNGESANVVDVIDDLSRGIWKCAEMVGHSNTIAEAAGEIAAAINNLAEAIRELRKP
jgi:hypothetical protein